MTLVHEYRPSMDADVLHSWAKDAVARIAELEAENVMLTAVWNNCGRERDDWKARVEQAEALIVAKDALLDPLKAKAIENAIRAEKAEAQRDDWRAMHRHAQMTIADLNADLKGQRARAEKAEAHYEDLIEAQRVSEADIVVGNEENAELLARAEKAEAERDELYNERHLFVIDKERQALQVRANKYEDALRKIADVEFEDDGEWKPTAEANIARAALKEKDDG